MDRKTWYNGATAYEKKEGALRNIPIQPPKIKQPWAKKFLGVGTLIGVGLAIFFAGWATGSGKISISLFWKNVSTENAQLPAKLDYTSVDQVYNSLRQNYDGKLDENTLLDGLKKGLASATGDPYTEYLNADETKEFNDDLNGKFSGIGAELSVKDKAIVVVSPLSGYPADKAGLQPNDVIAEINGESTADMSLNEAVSKIRGDAGTTVKLRVIRDGEALDFEIIRADITVPSVEYKILDGNIGYIKISRFADDTAKLSKEAADNFKQNNVKGVILDLRGNPGGLLNSAVNVSSLWLKPGTTVVQEKRDGQVLATHTASGDPMLMDIPTVVLINEGSASASEITAGALKDNGAATLVGANTFGKGSVQELENIPSGGVLKVTIARWYTPNGNNIDKQGIGPDKEVKRTTDDIKNDRDPQKDVAIDYLLKQIN